MVVNVLKKLAGQGKTIVCGAHSRLRRAAAPHTGPFGDGRWRSCDPLPAAGSHARSRAC